MTAATTSGICMVAPVRSGHAPSLLTDIQALPTGSHSPFARIPGVHFARFSLVPHLYGRLGGELGGSAQLVLASEFDQTPAEFVEAVRTRMPSEAKLILDHCVGFPGLDAKPFRRWMMRGIAKPGFSFAAYGGATVEEVRHRLHLRDRLAGFVVHAQELDPDRLRTAWLDAFGTAAR